jgi:cell division protein ZapE
MAQLDAVRVLQNVARGLMGWAPLSSIPESMKKQPPPKGAYLWSTLPGTGKSMLMELFYENVSIRQRRRTHFNAFMLEIHERLHALRTQPKIRESTTNSTTHSITQRLFGALLGHRQTRVGNRLDTEPNSVDVVASQIVESSWLLCLDEMQVTDIAEAMVLRRFYQTFRALGGVLVTTSNRAPAGLYENGLQRDLFLPFIEALQQNCYIHKLDGRVDYRLQTLLEENAASSALPLYIYPPTAANRQRFERLLQALAKSQENADSGASLALPYETMVIRTLGRNLLVERAIPGASIVRFRFPELCDRPLAAADYIALAERFQTFFLEDVPGCIRDRNLARRFITLIDILYDRRARLVCLAESPPEHLFQIVDEKSDEAFAAQRCISRIVDMQTKRYIQGNLGNAGEPNDLEVSSRPSVGAAS